MGPASRSVLRVRAARSRRSALQHRSRWTAALVFRRAALSRGRYRRRRRAAAAAGSPVDAGRPRRELRARSGVWSAEAEPRASTGGGECVWTVVDWRTLGHRGRWTVERAARETRWCECVCGNSRVVERAADFQVQRRRQVDFRCLSREDAGCQTRSLP